MDLLTALVHMLLTLAVAFFIGWNALRLVFSLVRMLCLVADRFTGLDSYGACLCSIGRHAWAIAETYARPDGCSDLWRCKRCGELCHKQRT